MRYARARRDDKRTALPHARAARPQVRVFEREDANRRTDVLKGIVGLALGAVGLALAVIILLAVPGFLTDRDSTVPLTTDSEAAR
ncbi:MAG TPA: hypothetical protein VKI44_12740 [Acetobacteraceae bacterium]|nr:hypothetical protein [Acetobacteraceae bacterium]